MARFFLINGNVGLRRGEADTPGEGVPAGATVLADAAGATDFDPASNAQLLADFDAGYSRFSAAAGVVRRDGANVTYAADLTATVQRRGYLAGVVGVKADRSTTSGAYVDIPDLAFVLDPNTTYAFDFLGAYTAAAATTGVQLALNGPAGPAVFGATFEVYTGVTAVLAAVAGAYDAGVNGTASGGATALPFRVSGVIRTGAAGGTLTLRGRSEVAGSAVTIKQGSYGRLFKAG